jgi:hypothetical protein
VSAALVLALSFGACNEDSPTAATPATTAPATGAASPTSTPTPDVEAEPTPAPAPNQPPVASFRLTPAPDADGVIALAAGDSLRVNMCQSSDPDEQDSLNYEVEWGDGETSSGFCRPEHVYAREGTFTLVASVTDKHLEDQARALARVSMTASVRVRGPEPQVRICHKAGPTGYILIEINGNAEDAHRAHGDARPGEAVPGQPGKVFDESCAVVDENAAIDLEKATNGQDADAAPGPTLTVGDTVQWTYVVTNTGEVPLGDVAVSDDQGVAVSCPADTLATGASMTCTASGTVQPDQYQNVGTATGTGLAGTLVTDSDPSHYFGGASITVSVTKDGAGTGRVTSSPAGIDCGGTCSASFGTSQSIFLEAEADPGSVFGGWGGDADCADAVLSPDADKSCVATFDLEPALPTHTITVTKDGMGGGGVTSLPAGIDCGGTCSAAFPEDQRVELEPLPDAGSGFAGWSGDPDCSDGIVLPDADKTCNATFDLLPPPPATHTLQVSVVPAGSGTVTSSPAGIVCEDSCSADFEDGSTVTLTGRPADGFLSVTWSGDCAAADVFTSEVVMDADKSCQATFQ